MRTKALFGPAGNSESFYEDKKKHTFEAPEWLAGKGLDAYEYQCGNGLRTGIPALRKIGEEAAKHGIKLSLHTPYFISLSSVEEEKRLKSVDYITQSVEAAEALGADIIVIHTGSAAKITREEALSLAKETMTAALEATEGSTVRLGLETMGKLNQLGTLEEVIDICKLDDKLCPVVDFGHMNARNVGGLFNCADDYSRVFYRVGETLGDDYAKYLHCHFSKIEYTDKGEKKHLTFADDVFGPPFEPLMEAIARESVYPCIICESSGTMAEDALAMKNEYTRIITGADKR